MHPLVRAFSIFDPKPAAAADVPSAEDAADERKPSTPQPAVVAKERATSASLPLPRPKPEHAATARKPAAQAAHPKTAAVPKPKKKPEPAQ